MRFTVFCFVLVVALAIAGCSANPAESQAVGVQQSLNDVDGQGHENVGGRAVRQRGYGYGGYNRGGYGYGYGGGGRRRGRPYRGGRYRG